MSKIDETLILESFAVARRARENGNHPFGALLVNAENQVLLSAENTVLTDRDATGHAETNLVRAASRGYSPEFLATCSVYTSTEPCPMCAGAIFWANIRRVVFGLSSEKLYKMIGDAPSGAVLALASRDVFRHGGWRVEVVGPLLEDQAAAVHHGFWENQTS